MKNLPQLLKYLVWPGLTLLTAGLVVGLLNGWTVLAVSLLILGAMLIVAGLANADIASFWQSRSTQAGTNAAVSVLSVLVILGLVNFMGARYDSRTDLTEGQLLTLSPASQSVVKDLEQPTEVLIFSPAPSPSDQKLLENYQRFNPDFSYRYVAPFADPQLERSLGVETGGEVFLRMGEALAEGEADRDLFVQRVGPQEPLTEQLLTNKLVELGQNSSAVVYFLQGHGEYAIDGSQAGLFTAANRLQDENYTVAPLNLADTGSVPPDADVLIIAGVQTELFTNEVIAVRDYLEAGGSVFVMIDPQEKTGLEVTLSQWGVVPEDTIVIDTSGGGQIAGLGPAAPLVTDYGDHPITESFENGRSFYPAVRPLQVRDVADVEETPLLFTNQRSHAQSITVGELSPKTDGAPEGPFTIGVALSRPAIVTEDSTAQDATAQDSTAQDASSDAPVGAVNEDAPEDVLEDSSVAADGAEAEASTSNEETADEETAESSEVDVPEPDSEVSIEESRMVVIGNSTFATDGLFSQQLNGDVFLNAVGWLSKVEKPTLSIRPKEATDRRFTMSVSQQIFLMLLALLAFPVMGLVGAGVLWARRR